MNIHELMRDQACCLVLGGGGAKGVYHIGVWRALKELGIKVDAFVGASIGAIIAGFLAQGADDALEKLGKTIELESILALPQDLVEDGEVKLDLDSLSKAREFFHHVMSKKGLDTDPLRRNLMENLDEDAIRKSGKDLGIVTVNISDLQPREVFLEDMEDGHLVDYLMASAAFPGFESPSIEGKHYVDGGFYDNVPYAMARKRGYRRVIVSDISGLGRNRRPQTDGCVTAYIKNSIDMGGVLSFDHAFREAFLLLGWLDTMRVFGRLVGYSYFLEPDAEAEASCSAAECVDAAILPDRMRWDRRKLLVHLECAASILDVERVKAWTYAGLADEISRKRAAEEEHIQKLLGGAKGGMRGQVSTLRKAIADRSFDHSPYYYARLIASAVPKTAGAILGKALVGLYPELPAGMAWLDHAAIKH